MPPGTFTYRTGMAFGQRQVDEVKREHWVGRLVAGLVAVGIRHNPPRLHQHIALLLMEAHEQGTKRAIWQFLLNPFGLCRGPLSEVIEAELPFLTPLFELKDGTPVNWSAIPIAHRHALQLAASETGVLLPMPIRVFVQAVQQLRHHGAVLVGSDVLSFPFHHDGLTMTHVLPPHTAPFFRRDVRMGQSCHGVRPSQPQLTTTHSTLLAPRAKPSWWLDPPGLCSERCTAPPSIHRWTASNACSHSPVGERRWWTTTGATHPAMQRSNCRTCHPYPLDGPIVWPTEAQEAGPPWVYTNRPTAQCSNEFRYALQRDVG